ncbi:hypothetical protein SAMCFNEI73_Ch0252 [Sinorhizobium americanum]|uniref:Uncharacterized protein n=1 Tax=Sinorhizobium americanum TaxID=194963 RepID=A0A1L3LHQ1_9HYPH|nr:hypothetical protein [Sinorhizobium americanum]APG83049.1 hypothetical protein SAMCCGM7_Ch0254 [Sinorhizobium americanum CCGM7]APG89586.1 hypothetical protein SAMCFNEI73_Ch0252 [Sinorhizobium americanum]OAP36089.1 hypothetical protein ATC00_29545 [Sinorhizobium americanum]
MTSFRSAPSLFLAVLMLGLSATVAPADETPLNFAQSFHDLPGVRPVNPLQDGEATACEQVFIDRYGPFESSHGRPRYDTIYRCRKGDGPVFQSGRLPPSLERQKRGLNY